jgi:hypothetical protein
MKSVIYTLFIVLILASVVISQVKYTWNGGTGIWQTASNWSPNGVPGATDTVVINSGTIPSDQNVTVASIYLNSGTINGAGNFIITDTLIVNSGNLVGTGVTTIASGAVAKFVSSLNKNLSNFIVDGSLIVIGAGPVTITSGGQLINNGTVEIQNNNNFGSAGGSIVNNGNFIRTTQTGTATVSGSFTNNGSVIVQTGVLLINNLTGAGSFNMSTGAVFRINSGTSTLGGNTISGEGTFECVGGTLNFSGDDVMVSNATTFRQAGGTIGGSGNLVINGNFIFESGIHGGTGTTTIASGANLDFTTSSTKTIIRTFVVDGVLTVIGAGSVSITSGGQLINNGTVEIQNSNSFGSAGGNIVNNGNFIRTTQTGTATVSGSFTNNGVIEILIGTLSFTSSSLNNTAQGEIKGLGTLSPGSNFTNDGAVSPGTSPGVLKVSGNYPQSSSGVLNIEIGGFDLNNRDSLSVTQQAQLNGTLNIVFTNNFTPQIGDVFPFLSYQSRSGEFSQVNFPANVIGYIQYLSNGARIVIDSTTSVDEEDLDQPDSEKNKIPTTYELAQNYPNPFNPTTVISWQSPVSSHQTLKVYDVLGNQVATLVDEFREAGMFEITFRASNLSSGIYFYKLQAGDFVQTKKMILLK